MNLKGKLTFLSCFDPIYVDKIDIWKLIEDFLIKNNNEKCSLDYSMNSISIKKDETSLKTIKFEHDKDGILCLLQDIDKFGFTNLISYIENILQNLNSRNVLVNINEEEINICVDVTNDNVYELYYTENNSCEIPGDKVNEICKPGTENCCIFLTVSKTFSCEKFNSPIARTLLYKLKQKEMRASRIGNCKLMGRKENNHN
jgi:hypothetical protein